MSVAGVGIDHDRLTELVGKMSIRDGPKPVIMQKAKYLRGDALSLVFHSG